MKCKYCRGTGSIENHLADYGADYGKNYCPCCDGKGRIYPRDEKGRFRKLTKAEWLRMGLSRCV